MTQDFVGAVDFMAQVTRHYICNGQFEVPRIEPLQPVLQMELCVHWITDDDDGRASRASGRWDLSEEAASKLLAICEQEPAAFDLCKNIAAVFLGRDERMPDPLRTFPAHYLADQLKEPKRACKSTTWLRNAYYFWLCHQVVADFGVKLTRNYASALEQSACGAVQQGLERNRFHISF